MLCSPLKRARQTAEAISKACHLDSIIIDDLAERNLGVYEGLTKAEIQVRYPDLYVSNCTHLVDGAPTGGESQREFERRIRRVLSEIKQLYDGQQVLLVTHGFVAMMINKIMKRLSFDEMYAFHMGNGEIISYTLTS